MTKSLAVLSFVTGVIHKPEYGVSIYFLVHDGSNEQRVPLQFICAEFFELLNACKMVATEKPDEHNAFLSLNYDYHVDEAGTLKQLVAHDPYAVYQRRKREIVFHDATTTEILEGIAIKNQTFNLCDDGLQMTLTTYKGKTWSLMLPTVQAFLLADILHEINAPYSGVSEQGAAH